MMLLSNEETTSLPKIHSERSDDIEENSTSAYTDSYDNVSHSPRSFEDTTENTMTMESTTEVPSPYNNREYEESSSTMETSTSFAAREVSQDDDENDQSTTTSVDSAADEHSKEEEDVDMHMTTDTTMTTVESQTDDPSTSVDSFGKMTGLLPNEREETTESMKVVSRRPSTTTERSEQEDRTMVHTHSDVVIPMKTNTVTKLTIIPGTVKQTKVYMDAPKKPMMMMTSSNNNGEERLVQLDQGQN